MSKGIVNRIIIISVLMLAVLTGVESLQAGTGIYRDVEIISQSESELVFRYVPSDTIWSYDASAEGQILSLRGCDNIQDQEKPPVPVKSIILGIAPGSGISYRVLSSAWSNPFDVDYVRAEYETELPADFIEILKQSRIRSQTIQPLNIYPLKLDGEKASLLKEITVSINFESASTALKKTTGISSEGAFENLLEGLLLNYNQSRSWRKIKSASISLSAAGDIFSEYSDWYRLEFSATGLQKITGEALSEAGINISAIDPRMIRAFWAGGHPLSPEIGDDAAELREIAIYVDGEDDGVFDESDFILVYLPAASFYDYDSDSADLVYVSNNYFSKGVLFLSLSGSGINEPSRMQTSNVAPRSAGTSVYSFSDKRRWEQNNFLEEVDDIIYDYYDWYWREGESFEQYINVEDLTGFQLSRLNMRIMGRSPQILVNTFAPDSSIIKDGPYASYASFWSDAFESGLNKLDVVINSNIRNEHILDYLELVYQHRLQYRSGTFTFYGVSGTGKLHYSISGVEPDSTFYLCDASDFYSQRFLVGAQRDGESREMLFEYGQSENGFQRFALGMESALGEPSLIEPVDVADLFEPGSSYDIIVIAPDEYISAFTSYKSLRESDGYNVYLASVEDIYAQFSGGMQNPVAIRDFLCYAYQNWPKPAPSFVLLGGDGNYDFLNLTSMGKANYIPPYVIDDEETVSDENYILFDDDGWLDSDSSYPEDRGTDMIVARWPVRSAAEVSAYISKLAGYGSQAVMGSWQNSITYLADDENKPSVSYKERDHTDQAEELANFHTPDWIDRNKLYLIEYAQDSQGEKPEVKRKLIEALNDGTLLVNFIGHGNRRVWTDEHVFRNEDIASLNNSEKLPVVVAASCSIGEFDNPYDEGMAELFFRYEDGGAVACVATTRLVYSGLNAYFNYKFFDVLFSGEDFTLAEAVYIAKFLRQLSDGPTENDKKFIVFGDPVMPLAVPQYRIKFDSEALDSMAALKLVNVSGQIVDDNDQLVSNFDGTVYLSAFDNEQDKVYQYTNGTAVVDLEYTMPGARIFRGQAEVSGGEFELQFVVPRDISYGGDNARISAYAGAASLPYSASGALDSIVVSGSTGDITDSLEPEIEVYIDGQVLADGMLLPQGSLLRIELFDSSGINLSGEVGHKFILSLDDDPLYTYDLTEDFIYDAGSYRKGQAEFSLPEVDDGNYTLMVKAWDSANNSARSEYRISIGAAEIPQIVELYNVPNPFTDETQFYYELSDDASAVSIDIFTLSGRKIHTIGGLPGNSGENLTSVWNGRDHWGDQLANGVYIYKLSVRTSSGSSDNINLEKFGKLVILK